jgi:hypothetical protein
MLGEELRPGLEAEARVRQLAGQKAGASLGGKARHGIKVSHQSEFVTKADRKQPGNVNAQIGLAVGVGAGTVAAALKVKRQAPELADKVISGEMSLNAAERQAVRIRFP